MKEKESQDRKKSQQHLSNKIKPTTTDHSLRKSKAQETYFLDAKSLQTFVEKMQTKFQEIKIL